MKTVSIHALRALGISAALVLLAACAGHVQHKPSVPSSYGAYTTDAEPYWSYGAGATADGDTVARHLQERYDETFPYCEKYAGDPNPLPAILCSGILMRVSARGPGFNIWNPNPNAPIKQAVSFSWLRKDTGFNSLVFNKGSGFIILPHFYADSPGDGYTQLVVLCGYPFDGWTWSRTEPPNDGCVRYPNAPSSGPCQAQGITDSQKWLQRFGAVIATWASCGFTLKPQTPGANIAFYAISQIRRAVPNAFHEHNEFMVSTWRANDPGLPIEAFFYVVNTAGRAEAMANQADYKTQLGRWIPVIQITLPVAAGGAAAFRFLPADQAIPAAGQSRQRSRY